MAVGPDHQLALGCGGANSLIMDDRDGSTIAVVTGEGVTDEVWYNPGNNHYFFARSTAATLGVEDLVIVQSGGATLVARKDKLDRLKSLVEGLDPAGFGRYC